MGGRRVDRGAAAIAIAAVGAYVLVMAGATAAIADAASTCSSWPLCSGPIGPGSEPALLIAMGHRIAALVVGIAVFAASIVAWPTGSTRERTMLGLACGLYPVQVVIGAHTAIAGPTRLRSGLHLVLGMTIFASLLLALAWRLEPTGRERGITTERREVDLGSPADSGVPTAGTTDSVRDRILAYVRLTKPRLMWLLCLVAAAGMALAAGSSLSLGTVVATLGGGVLAIGASGTFNHVLERDVDRRMARTADRPLATDQVGVRRALLFGSLLTVGAVVAFLHVGVLAAILGLAAIAYYSVVYTLILKPNTVQNTVIGGLAGAFPAAIGAAAATGTVGPAALLLGGVIFLWTPAHFYNLALAYRGDYARGGFPMLPVVHGEATTHKHILWYLTATLLAAAALTAVAGLGPLFAATSVVFGAIFLGAVLDLHRQGTTQAALRSFHASNAYLGAVLVAVIIDALAL